MSCPAVDFVRFNFPISDFSGNKYLQFLYDKIVSAAENITDCTLGKEAEELLGGVGDVPFHTDYEEIIRKYGYLWSVDDPIELLFSKFNGRVLNESLKYDFSHDVLMRTLYNPFSIFATVPPQGIAQPFEKLLIRIAEEYFDGALMKSKSLNDIPASRYDVYNIQNDSKIEVKTTRLIDSNGIGSMRKRFLPYGLGRKFATGFKQVKLKYADVFVTVLVAKNVSLYAVFSNDSYRKLIIDGFVERVPMKNLSVSLVHNVYSSPSSREERRKLLDNSEFIITFSTYDGLQSYLSYADFVSFNVLDVVKKVIDGFS